MRRLCAAAAVMLGLGLGMTSKVDAHGMLTRPVSRALRAATGDTKMGYKHAGDCPEKACEWYTQWTTIPANATTTNCDPQMRTMGVNCGDTSPTDYPCSPGIAVPWCAPGTAPVKGPCGVFAGGYGVGADARNMLDLDGTPMEAWTAGETALVSWAITANHGGGYGFRLCRADSDLSEECFQAGHLKFVDSMQQVIDVNGTLVTQVPARRTANGTHPAGSQWTRNPFPQEKNLGPGLPGLPDVYGRGPFPYSIIDEVAVPKELKPGHYILSWRWDAEQTKQVWSHCSDVLIVAAGTTPAAATAALAAVQHEAGIVVGAAAVGAPTGPNADVCVGESVGLATDDCTAWVSFYDSLDGENWPASWKTECDSLRTDPCGCQGTWQKWIVCSAFRDFAHITEIYLLSNTLKGTIPPAFTGMKHLQSLSLVDTQITGSLPADMGKMAGLQMIWLDHNPSLGGAVPQSLLELGSNLAVLELHRSNFTGVLPALNYRGIPDCTLNDMVFECPLPAGAETCGAVCH